MISGWVQGLAALAVGSNWIWGIALPMSIAGIATHYLTLLRARWAAFWQQNEQRRSAPVSTWKVRAWGCHGMPRSIIVSSA